MININILGLLAAMTFSPHPTDGTPIDMVCTVSGAEVLTPPMTGEQVCTVIALQMTDGLKRDVHMRSSDQTAVDAGLVRVDVRFEPQRGAIAVIETSRNGKRLKSPELSVTAMDRSLNSSDIDQLGRDIAQYVVNN